jgi:hypothetical protein
LKCGSKCEAGHKLGSLGELDVIWRENPRDERGRTYSVTLTGRTGIPNLYVFAGLDASSSSPG